MNPFSNLAEKWRRRRYERLQNKMLSCYLYHAYQHYKTCYEKGYPLCDSCPYRTEK